MTTSKQMEPNVNNALGNLLKSMMPTCTVLAENTQIFPDHPGRHADVLVTATGRSPVTVEAEFEPAPEAEKDARERLGLKVDGEPRTIEASVAVRYPMQPSPIASFTKTKPGSLNPAGSKVPCPDLADLVRLETRTETPILPKSSFS